ncbi:DUF3052 domain-containing protein [Streptomyces sp. NPDC004126]|uniref:DUF3052 domain-containing protein n=1 Tax=Streptomyces sp. NPDC004126 TaxID=3390695 RepID=UPI003D03EB1D
MTVTTAERSLGERLGLKAGQVVQEFGRDDDIDDELRKSVEAVTENQLVDEDHDDVVDVVLLWWREEDGDLFDELTASMESLNDAGLIWLLTPKAGRDGHVEPSDIGEAASLAGLAQTKSVSAAMNWSGTLLVAPKVRK